MSSMRELATERQIAEEDYLRWRTDELVLERELLWPGDDFKYHALSYEIAALNLRHQELTGRLYNAERRER
jgi:hypothetical protein